MADKPGETDSQSALSFEGLQCSNCGYDLRGLNTLRCPECGAAFDSAALLDCESAERAFRRKIVRYGNCILLAGMTTSFCEALIETGSIEQSALITLVGPIFGTLFVAIGAPLLALPWLVVIAAAIVGGLRRREYWPFAIMGYFAAAATWVLLTRSVLAWGGH